MSCVNPNPPACGSQPNCPDCYGCSSNIVPDFQIKRYDTRPPFKVSVQDENGPIDLTGLVIEANMWASAKLKNSITAIDTSLAFANNIGFCQILVNDLIVVTSPRSSEHMRITGFDEVNYLVFVERGVDGTTPQDYNKGTHLKIFRIINSPGLSEMVYEDSILPDGTPVCNVLTDSILVYEWNINDTCAAGCFSFEFKVLQMGTTTSGSGECFLGTNVEWARRFPTCGNFVVKVCETPTAELMIPPSTT